METNKLIDTENLKKFVDGIVESAYQSRVFQKEAVHEVLLITELVKNKLVEADTLAEQNLELKVKIEILESENKLLKDKFSVSDGDIENLKNENIINEIDVNDVEEVSTPSKNGTLPKVKKLQ